MLLFVDLLLRLRLFVVENLYAEHAGKMLNGFGIGLIVKIHHEVNWTAVRPAAETVVGVSARTHNERRCPFIVKWAAGPVMGTTASELYLITRHNVHDVGTVMYLPYCRFVYHKSWALVSSL